MLINAKVGYLIQYPKLINKLRDLFYKYKHLGFKRKNFLPILGGFGDVQLRGFVDFKHNGYLHFKMYVNITKEKSTYFTKYFEDNNWADKFYELVCEQLINIQNDFNFLKVNKPLKTVKGWNNDLIHIIHSKMGNVYVEETAEHFVIKNNHNFTYFCQNVFHKNRKNDMDYFISDFLKLFEK